MGRFAFVPNVCPCTFTDATAPGKAGVCDGVIGYTMFKRVSCTNVTGIKVVPERLA